MKKYLTAVLIIICGTLSILTAQTTAEKKPPPQWWLNSSLADSADWFLFHAEGQYSYTKMTGSTEGDIQSGTARLSVRKNIFTNHTEYMLDKTKMSIKSLGMHYATESQIFTDYLDVDITRLLYGEAGFIWEMDNSLYIKNRYSLYAGAGLTGQIFDKHYLKILIAFGRIDQDYTVPVDGFDVVKGIHTEFYARQNYKFVINQTFSFMELAYYLVNINNSDRYRVGVILNLSIVIVQPVSLILGYNYKYDKESELLGAIAANTTQSIGINVSL